MAKRLWKRKRPDREVKTFKQEIKLEGGVFDRHTLLTLDRLLKKGVIESIDYCISTGKEADVFRGTDVSGFVAIKIFRILTSKFNRFFGYLDERTMASMRKSRKGADFRTLWCAKEFRNLTIAIPLEISPSPIFKLNNVIVMSFMGEEGLPYPLLIDYKGELTHDDYLEIISMVQKLYSAGLVHSDLSEYNIMVSNSKFHAIDFAQAVEIDHPNANEYLERDITNINRFFSSKGIEVIPVADLLERIKGKKD